jgi:ribonucleotide reductase beta subunit family protein with ferritin-like domain
MIYSYADSIFSILLKHKKDSFWCFQEIPALRELSQDVHKFEASLDDRERAFLKKEVKMPL